jgi:hypothetical protein
MHDTFARSLLKAELSPLTESNDDENPLETESP